jgi:hypothetical protein
MPERSELAGEFGIARSLHLAPWGKISPAEQVGRRYNCRSHGTVLIGTLRPGEIVIQPKIEAQSLWYIAMGQVFDRGQQVVVTEGLAQHPASGKLRCQLGVGSGGHIEHRHGTGEIQKNVRLIGDHQIRRNVPVSQKFTRAQCIAKDNFVAVPFEHGPQETTDKGIFRH